MNLITRARVSFWRLFFPQYQIYKTLYVHIGTHKTGTTSIQNFLRVNAFKLKSSGIYVPNSCFIDDQSGHHALAWAIRGDIRYSPELGGTAEMLSELKSITENKAVISSEDFEYLSQYPARLAAMDRAFHEIGFAPIYLVYFREREAYIKSLYTELLKHGLTQDFEFFRSEALTNHFVRSHGDWYFEMNFDRFLQQWRSVIGDRILHFSYEEASANNGLLPHFLRQIGAPPPLILQGTTAQRLNITAAPDSDVGAHV